MGVCAHDNLPTPDPATTLCPGAAAAAAVRSYAGDADVELSRRPCYRASIVNTRGRELILTDSEIYAAIGEPGFARLVAAFYRQVPGDDILGPMYPADDMAGAEERLRDFLIGRFGGPQRYVRRRGHPRLRARHFPFPIDVAARDRWLRLMDHAVEEADVPEDAAAALRSFFQAVAQMMVNRHPDGAQATGPDTDRRAV